MSSILTKSHRPGLDEVTLDSRGFYEKKITVAAGQSDPLAMFSELLASARARSAHICSHFVLGGTRFFGPAFDRMGKVDWPVTWLQGDPCDGTVLTGCQATAVYGVDVQSIRLDGRVVGKLFETPDAVVCHLGEILPDDADAPREVQARQVFDNAQRALASVGLAFTDVIRTWLYLSRLLEWYGPFNEVRTQFFDAQGVFDALVPASTGIGAGNPAGAAMVADALAIRPKQGAVKVLAVPSPLQCPALDYKSSFSRAVEIQWPKCRELLISGTASIDPDGHTAHLGDCRAQIDLTMQVVRAILDSRGMTWDDTTRAIAYFKDLADAPLLAEYCRTNGLPHMPIALSHADVCRDDLLFEIELDAAAR